MRHLPSVRAEGRVRHVLTMQWRILGKGGMQELPRSMRYGFGQVHEYRVIQRKDFEELRWKEALQMSLFLIY